MAVDSALHVEVLVARPLNRNGPIAFDDAGTSDFRRNYRVKSQEDERAERQPDHDITDGLRRPARRSSTRGVHNWSSGFVPAHAVLWFGASSRMTLHEVASPRSTDDLPPRAVALADGEEFVDEMDCSRVGAQAHARACWPASSLRLSVTLFSD